MIVVTGANGKLGRMVVEKLLDRLPASQIGVSVRDPQKAQALQERGVRVRQGSFDDPASLDQAFEGVSQLLLVSIDNIGEVALRQHRQAIEAAKRAGASRIFYTSHMGSSPNSAFLPMLDHAATEAALQEAGIAYTSLRNGFYASTTVMLVNQALQTGVLAAPEDGPVSWTAHEDLAEITAVALSEGIFNGITPPLTASEALDLDGVAAFASEILERPIRRVVVPEAEFQASLTGHGVPEAVADMLLGMYRASKKGEFARVDPTLERVLDRPATSLREVLKAALLPGQ
ncbi:MAG: SDR family oxidoreductase [Chloroflexi bacterium]|nr:SDR family oxidoreductase [Chloroflexota bacterium]OJV98341.1 MAG: NAD(P)-dependent oxidoreductase [Chloroflexi bacterium 54-19]